MLRAWRTFFKRFYVTRGVCMLSLVLCLIAVAGCTSDTTPKNDGSETAAMEKLMKGCWTCPIFEKAYSVASAAPGSIIPQVARGAINLVGVGYALWLAIFILKYVSSLNEPDVAAFWKGLGVQTFWTAMGAALLRDLSTGGTGSALTMFAQPVFSGFVDAGLAIVRGTSGDISCGGGGGSGLLCLVKALQDKLNIGSGISLVGIFLGPTIFVMFIGVIVFIVSVIFMVYIPLLLLDGVFRYGIASTSNGT